MEDDVYEKYKRAGEIAAKARDYGIQLIKPGERYLDVVNNIETKIREEDAGLAFPVNISINELAAHYTPREDDTLVFEKGDIVKLDVGSHVEGYIADTAVTIELGTNNYRNLIDASCKALGSALDVLRADVDLSVIGAAIETTIQSQGYRSIDNLTGHSLGRYNLHSGISIPNVSQSVTKVRPQEGDVLAIEPFATNGYGHVTSGDGSNIYRCRSSNKFKLIRKTKYMRSFNKLFSRYHRLPFARRWCMDLFPNVDHALRKLTFLGVITQYPQLIETKKGVVTQKEHTVIIHEDGCETIT